GVRLGPWELPARQTPNAKRRPALPLLRQEEESELMNAKDKLVRTIRVRNRHEPGVFGQLATAIGEQQAALGNISTVALTSQYTVRDLDVLVDDETHLQRVLDAIAALADSQVLEVRDEVLAVHRGGKIRMVSRY